MSGARSVPDPGEQVRYGICNSTHSWSSSLWRPVSPTLDSGGGKHGLEENRAPATGEGDVGRREPL